MPPSVHASQLPINPPRTEMRRTSITALTTLNELKLWWHKSFIFSLSFKFFKCHVSCLETDANVYPY